MERPAPPPVQDANAGIDAHVGTDALGSLPRAESKGPAEQSSAATAAPPKNPSLASTLLRFRRRNQRDRSLRGQQQESERLLQIQADRGIGVAKITDGDILPNVKVEIAAASGQHESAGNRGCPDDLIVDQPFDVLQHRVSVVAGFSERGVRISAEQ